MGRASALTAAVTVVLMLPLVSACDSSGPSSVGNSASNEAPDPRFTISEATPRVGQKVTLDASGSSDPDGEIENYLWDFGADGGSEKTGEQVTWRFEAADTTAIELTVTDSDGETATNRREATVQPGIEAAFTAEPEEPRAGREVTFDASASEDPLGQIQSYEWDFDADGEADANGETATWIFDYERGDSASVSLTVTGEENVRGTTGRKLPLLPPQIELQLERPRLAQTVQRYEGEPVPLVAGRDGLLRIFLRASQDNPYSPEVEVRLFHDGELVETLSASSEDTVPTDPSVGDLTDSWNVFLPGELVQPGLSVVVQANPEGGTPIGQPQFPSDGEPLALDVRETPPLRLTMVPVEVSATGETAIVNEGDLETYLEQPRDLFPISTYDTDIHSTYTTDVQPGEGFASRLLDEIEALRTAEGSDRHYYGVFSESVDRNFGGYGFIPGKSAVGVEGSSSILAHELGHNFNRRHAPCGGPSGIDQNYPYPNASIGKYGLDVEERALREPGEWKDLMSYCGPEWISDYTYTGILNYRQDEGGAPAKRSLPGSHGDDEPVLLVWGHVADGKVTLEPAFEVSAPPKVPSGQGPYTLEGFDKQDRRLFTFSFSGAEVADGRGERRSFAFAIPKSRVGSEQLARLRVSGNGVSEMQRSGTAQEKARPLSQDAGTLSIEKVGRNATRLQWDAPNYRAVMVRDESTGEVLSIARGGAARLRARSARTVTLLFSDGVRTTRRSARIP